MAIAYSYPIGSPASGDLLLGTKTPVEGEDFEPNKTLNFTIQSIVDLIAVEAAGVSGTVGKIPVFTAATTVGNSIITQSNGKIGIRIDIPTQELHVDGSARVTGGYYDSSNLQGTSGQILSSTGSGTSWVDAISASGDLIANRVPRITSANTLATGIIRDDGSNVGIKTDAATNVLTVSADLGSGAGSDGIFIKDIFAGTTRATGTNNPMLSLGTSTDAGSTATIFMGQSDTATDQDTKIEFARTGGTLTIACKGGGALRDHVQFGDATSATPKSVFFGKVGIGKTNPESALDVDGVLKVRSQIDLFAGSNQVLSIFSSGGTNPFINSPSGQINFGAPSANTTNVNVQGLLSAQDISVYNTGVGSSLKLTSSSTASGGNYIHAKKSDGSNQWVLGSNSASDDRVVLKQYNAADIIFQNNGGDRVVIASNGNVGIGATGPGNTLDVNGEINASGDGYYIDGEAWALKYSGVLSLGDWDNNGFETRIMDENAIEVLRVADGKLDVAGNIKVSGGYYDSSNSQGASGKVLSSTGSGTSWIDGLVIGTTSSTALAGNTVTISNAQANAIAANTSKTGITTQQADAITTNTAKVGYTEAAVSANTNVAANTAKVGYTDALVSSNTAVAANTAKVGITTQQANAIIANTAKVTFPGLGTTSSTALAGDTTTISSVQATAINDSVKNNTDTYTGTAKITQIVSLSQAQYDAISSPLASTLYIIL